MADITDTQVIKFVNEVARPTAETLRALVAQFDSINTRWSSFISVLVPNDAQSIIQDGRDSEGVSRLTGKDVNDLMYAVAVVTTALNSLAAQTIEKPCVRPLSVS